MVSLPRGRFIVTRREPPPNPAAPNQHSSVDRYIEFKERYGVQVLALLVFLAAAAYMATRPIESATETILTEATSPTVTATSSDPEDIAIAYARFGEEVRQEARKHAAEIKQAIANDVHEPSLPPQVRHTSPYTRSTLVGKVLRIIKRYAPRHRDPLTLAEAIVAEAETQNYDPLFVAAVIKSESAFNALARSHKGAQGLMQIMPATGRWLAQEAMVPRGSLTDPGHNLELGVRYLKQLEAQYNGDRVFTLIAYNWGPGHVESAAGGKRRIPPEVVTYAIKILNDYRRWRSGG